MMYNKNPISNEMGFLFTKLDRGNFYIKFFLLLICGSAVFRTIKSRLKPEMNIRNT